MVVTWGKPQAASGLTVLGIAWDDCIQKCWGDASCVVVYDTSPTCTYYVLGQVISVEKLIKDSESRVAFKVRSSTQDCSDPALNRILTGGTVQSEAELGGQNVPYNITLENDLWKFSSINLTLVCPTTSRLFTRGSVSVCMTVVQTPTCINRPDAAASCSSFGVPDTLMGIASSAEIDYVQNVTKGLLSRQKSNVTYLRIGFWIDGSRKDSCKPPATKNANCNGFNEFTYSDPYATGPAFQWRPNQPDGLTIGDANSDCLFFRVSSEAGDVAGVGDMPCSAPTYPLYDICYAGYLCGSYPTYTIA